ncbi:probable glutamate receptor [Gopherus flavomarginatus]|uniref:probable glutamate receptor n=1 Tax=Gopherus flavomarginatus TaxID=286002 RepID=UPI0021CBE964|nr:probable glutamate receptor [Gopherus flavomarginatus]XP_050787677.1 probable glutamate receptor [Gopherus flavomarginatus]XP_050787679.1 probable glutamate receptor [Gopherus flavomarginatus]
MEEAFRLALCVMMGLLLLRGSRLAGAIETGNAVSKGNDEEGKEATDPQTLTVTTILQDPYAMARGTELEGYCLDLLDALAKMLHFNYKVTIVKDGRYGAVSSGGNWTGMVGEIVRQEADLAVAPLTITSARDEVISFTMPFLATGIGILLRKEAASQGASLFGFLAPFSKETWTGVMVAYLLTCLCLFLAARLSPCEWKEPKSEENHFTFLNSLWFGAGALTLQGAAPHPKALSGRIIATIWWLFTISLLAAYIANFTALLSSGNEPLPIQTFEDLVKQREIEFGTVEGSSTFQFFKNSRNPIHQMIYEYMDKRRDHVLVKNYHEAFQRVLESNYAFIGESISQDLLAARHCNLIRAPEVIGARGFGIATAKGSPWANKLSLAVLKLGESGNLDYLHNKWWETTCFHKGPDTWSPLKPQAMGGLFLVLAIGLVLGVIVALVELSNRSRHAAEREKKSCCSVLSEEMSHRFRIKEGVRENPEKVKP